jgi:hypothetical protein
MTTPMEVDRADKVIAQSLGDVSYPAALPDEEAWENNIAWKAKLTVAKRRRGAEVDILVARNAQIQARRTLGSGINMQAALYSSSVDRDDFGDGDDRQHAASEKLYRYRRNHPREICRRRWLCEEPKPDRS